VRCADHSLVCDRWHLSHAQLADELASLIKRACTGSGVQPPCVDTPIRLSYEPPDAFLCTVREASAVNGCPSPGRRHVLVDVSAHWYVSPQYSPLWNEDDDDHRHRHRHRHRRDQHGGTPQREEEESAPSPPNSGKSKSSGKSTRNSECTQQKTSARDTPAASAEQCVATPREDNQRWQVEYLLESVRTGVRLLVGGDHRAGVLHLVRRYGFYEGGEPQNRYRVHPRLAHSLLLDHVDAEVVAIVRARYTAENRERELELRELQALSSQWERSGETDRRRAQHAELQQHIAERETVLRQIQQRQADHIHRLQQQAQPTAPGDSRERRTQ
jgi:hypothetical protein